MSSTALLSPPPTARPARGLGTAAPVSAAVGGGAVDIVLDLSRLLSRVLHGTPTGIDRVELAYARHLAALVPDRLQFAATHPLAGYGRLSSDAVRAFLDVTEARWTYHGGNESRGQARAHALRALISLRPLAVPREKRNRVILQVSPNGLDRSEAVARRMARERARLICLVHDLIPIDFPEYARPDGMQRHVRRMETVARFASGILVNSVATGRSLANFLDRRNLPTPPLEVVPLAPTGTLLDGECDHEVPIDGPGYFVCLGTIEPRKNHLLLLNVWRRLIETRPATTIPTLVLVGRRGWENENILDLLDRSTSLRPFVQEHGRLSDAALGPLLRNARALLMPSFAEGFGMPIADAVAAGIPVIASDLPAHREAGGIVPDYLDPIDGAGWLDAIMGYTAPASIARIAQLARVRDHAGMSWERHIKQALAFIDEVTAC